jgi:hypothetical protein
MVLPHVAEVLGAHAAVSKLRICVPRASEPKVRDIYRRIDSVQGFVHLATSTLSFHTSFRVAIVMGRVAKGPFPLARAVKALLTAPR